MRTNCILYVIPCEHWKREIRTAPVVDTKKLPFIPSDHSGIIQRYGKVWKGLRQLYALSLQKKEEYLPLYEKRDYSPNGELRRENELILLKDEANVLEMTFWVCIQKSVPLEAIKNICITQDWEIVEVED